ncbi:MAG: hypothetical protein A3H97_15220 [Acidobacteria bacterium RIFCSPLOWO2_02_FULL_65_29]|nr:MAG: hypothetical protein A3H97_15220 [Acidobacteria bacterium RIFCSPLOWO2_02_FULL_65_29]
MAWEDAAVVPSRLASERRETATERKTSEAPRPQRRKAKTLEPADLQAVRRAAQRLSNALASLVFWVFIAGGIYWFISSDEMQDVRSLLRQWLQEQALGPAPAQEPPPRTAPAPAVERPVVSEPARPAAPAATGPTGSRGRGGEAPAAARSSANAARAAARGTPQPPATRGSAPPSPPPGATLEREVVPALQPASPPPAAAPTAAAATPAPAGQRGASSEAIEGLSPAQVIQRLGPPPNVITSNGVTRWVYQGGALIVYFVKDRATLKAPR